MKMFAMIFAFLVMFSANAFASGENCKNLYTDAQTYINNGKGYINMQREDRGGKLHWEQLRGLIDSMELNVRPYLQILRTGSYNDTDTNKCKFAKFKIQDIVDNILNEGLGALGVQP